MPEYLSKTQIIAELTKQKTLEKRAAAVGQELIWEFNNLKPLDPNEGFFVRFKYDVSLNPADLQIYGKWLVGDYRQVKYSTKVETPIYTFDRKDVIRSFHEIKVPGDAIAKDGYLAVGFLNLPLNDTVVIFPPTDGLEVLYRADSFGWNFLRAVCLILFRLVFLASLAMLASTFLSFPVAILLCLVLFFTAHISGFVIDSFGYMSQSLSGFYSYIIRPVIELFPRFDLFNPTKFLVPARLLSWSLLARAAAIMLGVKALLLFVLSLVIFSYREIARITV